MFSSPDCPQLRPGVRSSPAQSASHPTAGPDRVHYANELAPSDIEGNSLEPDFAFAKTVGDFIHIEGANDIALFLDDSFRKVAPQKLSYVDANAVAVFERRSRAHGGVTHDDGTIRFNDLQHAHPLVVT